MAYENVNVDNAKKALNAMLNSINSKTSESMINNLDENVWSAESKKTMIQALDKLVNTRYSDLKKYIKECLKKLDKIQEYKNMQEQISSCTNNIQGKSNQLRELQKIDDRYKQENKYYDPEAVKNRQRIIALKQEISNLERQRGSNSSSMTSLERQINS